MALLSLTYELLSHRTIIDGELSNLKNISDEIAQHINSHLKEKANIALTLSSAPLITTTLRKSNAEFSVLQELERKSIIAERNEHWIKTKNSDDPFIQAHMSTPAAQYLKKQQELLPATYGEIFLTNAYGVMIATTGKLTTLAHAHKYWWKNGFHDGRGKSSLMIEVLIPVFRAMFWRGCPDQGRRSDHRHPEMQYQYFRAVDRCHSKIFPTQSGTNHGCADRRTYCQRRRGNAAFHKGGGSNYLFIAKRHKGINGGATVTNGGENQLVAFSPVTMTQGSEKSVSEEAKHPLITSKETKVNPGILSSLSAKKRCWPHHTRRPSTYFSSALSLPC